MLSKISLNVGVAIMSLLAILINIWNHYQYSFTYTRSDWITIALYLLIILFSLYREHKAKK